MVLQGIRVHPEGENMADLVYIGITLLFFALTYGLIVVCERLMEDKP